MNKKMLDITKKALTIMILVVLMIPNFTNAVFSFSPSKTLSYTMPSIPNSSKWYNNSSIMSQVSKMYNSVMQYAKALRDANSVFQGVNTNANVDELRTTLIDEFTKLLEEYKDSAAASTAISKLLNIITNSDATNSADLVTTTKDLLEKLISSPNFGIESLNPDVVINKMDATTAGKRAGSKYNVKLSAKIYFHEPKNGKPTSNKWVVLVHGNMMNGQAIADSLGQMYLDQGFNILAPDLRGAGDSEGSVAMGYLESLDIWDWLTYINDKYECKEIFVHGVSLGGATTIQLSGLSEGQKTLKDQNVIGLVEDCGYASMTGIIKELLGSGNSDSKLSAKKLGISDKTDFSEISNNLEDTVIQKLLTGVVDTGLTDENFEELQDGLNSLKKCEVPILIVHGTKDTTVPFENSDLIYNTAMANDNIPYVQRFIAEGEPHAFIVLGSRYGAYEGHVEYFVEQAEKVARNENVEKEQTVSVSDKKTSVITNLVRALKLIKNIIKK